MKIFQAVNNPYQALTPYMHTFMSSISSQYGDVKWGWGPEKIWLKDIFSYDIIHIHWPDLLLCGHSPQDLSKRIQEIKAKNIIIICTCHNLVPHYCNDPQRINAYSTVYNLADYMIHLGQYSLNIQKAAFPHVKHIFLFHHVYNNLYKKIYSKQESCQKLGISSSNTNILCFGTFRSDDERILVKQVAKKLKKNNVYILAPNFWGKTRSELSMRILLFFKRILYKKIYHVITNRKESVSDEKLPFYYGASDIAFIQRLNILNSGTVPMALLMGKTVVGPNQGNVAEILQKTENFMFDAQDFSSIVNSITNAIHSDYQQKGIDNRNFALQFLSTEKISSQLHGIYQNCIKEKVSS